MSEAANGKVRPRRPAQVAGAAFGFGLALALAWLVGLVWFAATVPGEVEDPATATDAIVVLTGGSERVATGVALLEAELGGRLFVSGVHKGVEVADLLKTTRHRSGRPELAGHIALGYEADDTVGNAVETAAWMRTEKVRTVRLVTAAYHMRRSLLEFRHAMPGAVIVPHPVFPDAVKHEWWRWPGTAHLLATEWTKYLAAVLRNWVVPAGEWP
jgi:uncharacterized SAM-binding protein YcdF (DUF218 family)